MFRTLRASTRFLGFVLVFSSYSAWADYAGVFEDLKASTSESQARDVLTTHFTDDEGVRRFYASLNARHLLQLPESSFIALSERTGWEYMALSNQALERTDPLFKGVNRDIPLSIEFAVFQREFRKRIPDLLLVPEALDQIATGQEPTEEVLRAKLALEDLETFFWQYLYAETLQNHRSISPYVATETVRTLRLLFIKMQTMDLESLSQSQYSSLSKNQIVLGLVSTTLNIVFRYFDLVATGNFSNLETRKIFVGAFKEALDFSLSWRRTATKLWRAGIGRRQRPTEQLGEFISTDDPRFFDRFSPEIDQESATGEGETGRIGGILFEEGAISTDFSEPPLLKSVSVTTRYLLEMATWISRHPPFSEFAPQWQTGLSAGDIKLVNWCTANSVSLRNRLALIGLLSLPTSTRTPLYDPFVTSVETYLDYFLGKDPVMEQQKALSAVSEGFQSGSWLNGRQVFLTDELLPELVYEKFGGRKYVNGETFPKSKKNALRKELASAELQQQEIFDNLQQQGIGILVMSRQEFNSYRTYDARALFNQNREQATLERRFTPVDSEPIATLRPPVESDLRFIEGLERPTLAIAHNSNTAWYSFPAEYLALWEESDMARALVVGKNYEDAKTRFLWGLLLSELKLTPGVWIASDSGKSSTSLYSYYLVDEPLPDGIPPQRYDARISVSPSALSARPAEGETLAQKSSRERRVRNTLPMRLVERAITANGCSNLIESYTHHFQR